MWELEYKESWVLKNWCFWTVVLEKILESPLDSMEIQSIHPKGNQSWIFIRRTDAEASILWPPDENSWLIRKDPDAGKNWRQKKGMTEDEMVGWHHQLNGHKPEYALGVGDGQGGLACCSPWGHRESDTTEHLNWTELMWEKVTEQLNLSWVDFKEKMEIFHSKNGGKWYSRKKISWVWKISEYLGNDEKLEYTVDQEPRLESSNNNNNSWHLADTCCVPDTA